MPPPSTPTPPHNLTAAYLFLRTASTAVANLTAQTASTSASLRAAAAHEAYATRLETEARELRMWEGRLVEAGIGVVEWAARVRTGRGLPGEILGMIGEGLRGGGVLPEVW